MGLYLYIIGMLGGVVGSVILTYFPKGLVAANYIILTSILASTVFFTFAVV